MASLSGSVSWMPAPGRHAVNIGSSLGKALKARKLKASPTATVNTKRSNLPERDFYSFRFNFKPPSIDTTKPASIEIQRSADNAKVSAEYPSTHSGEAHIFLGAEQSAREVDCVLIYDEDTGTYSLEKLDSFVSLHYDRKTTVSPRPSPAPPTQKTAKSKGKQRQVIDELERELLGLDEDAEGDVDMDVVVQKSIARKEEEEEEALRPLKPASPVPPKAQPPLPPKARPVKPIPKPRVEAKALVAAPQPSRQKPTSPPPPDVVPIVSVLPVPGPPRPKSQLVQKKEQVQHREPVQPKEPVQQTGSISKKGSVQNIESAQRKEPIQKKEKKTKPTLVPPPIPTVPSKYADEEVIEFGRPTKRPRPSAPQQPLLPLTSPATVALSLPGGSSSFAPPPPPLGSHGSRGPASSSHNVPPTIVPPPAAPAQLSLPTSAPVSSPTIDQYESEESEDWDEVSTAIVDDKGAAYELALEQEIFADVFEEVDGDDEGQATTQPYVDGEGEEEEIDVNAFEQELNEHMEVEEEDDSDDDVFGGLAVESEPDLQDGTRQPISLNRLALGGVGVEMSEEEYSSSDDSDDD